MMIDAHVHLLPRDVRMDPSAMRERDPWFAECFPGEGAMADTVELGRMLDDQLCDACVIAGWPFRSIDDCHAMTEAAAEAHRTDARMAFLAMIHPLDPHLDDALDHAQHLGCCGVGELNMDGFGIDNDRFLYQLAEACADRDLPILVHCSEPVGHQYPGKGTFTPLRVEELLRAVPECTVVLAHLGGGLPFYGVMPEVQRILAHAYVDTAAGPWLYTPNVLPIVAGTMGWDRIIFGSDFPLMTQRRIRDWLSSSEVTVPDGFWGRTASRVYHIPSSQENVG